MIANRLNARSVGLLITAVLFARFAGFRSSVTELDTAESGKIANTRSKTVLINHFAYQPDILTVNLGDTVEWKNVDIVPHSVTATDRKSFDSGGIANGASWRFTVTTRGRHDYFCTLHPNMTAKLIVQ